MNAPREVDPRLGIPTEEVPATLSRLRVRLREEDPLCDGGFAIQVHIEAGDVERASALLETATARAVADEDAPGVFTTHLLRAYAKRMAGDREMARRFLDKALAMRLEPPPVLPLIRLRRMVGLEVCLWLQDDAESEAFLRERRDDPPGEESLRAWRSLWSAQLALRRGETAAAETLLVQIPLPADAAAGRESTWRALALLGECAAARGETASAVERLDRALGVVRTIAQRIPSAKESRRYREAEPRKRLAQRRVTLPGAPSPSSSASSSFLPRDPQGMLLASVRGILEGIRDLGRHGDLDRLLDTVLDAMIRFCGARRGLVVYFSEGDLRAERGRHAEGRALRPEEMRISRTIAERTAHEGKTVNLEDALAHEDFRQAESVMNLRVRSVLAVPLIVEGRRLGALYLDDPDTAGVFTTATVQTAEVLAEHAALALEHARLLERVTVDALTGAYAHAFFEDQLRRAVELAQRHGRSLGLLVVDLDNFKAVNDTFGHEFGNRVLQATVDTLTTGLRRSDVVGVVAGGTRKLRRDQQAPALGRFGGDEFEVLLPDTGPDGLAIVAAHALDRLTATVLEAGGRKVPLAVSIGGASFPHHAATAEALFRAADEALYRAKREGRNRFALAGGAASPKPSASAPCPTDALLHTAEGRRAVGLLVRLLEHAPEVDALLDGALALIAEAIGAERGFALLYDREDRVEAVRTLGLDEAAARGRTPAGCATAVERARATRRGVLVADVGAASGGGPQSKEGEVRSQLAVPVPDGNGRPGVLYFDIVAGTRRFTPEDLALVDHFLAQASALLLGARSLAQRTAAAARGGPPEDEGPRRAGRGASREAASLKERLRAVERAALEEALAACAGNRSQAARRLGIKRTTLIRRIAVHRLGDGGKPARRGAKKGARRRRSGSGGKA